MSPKTDENSTGTLYTNYNADNLNSYTVFCKKKIFIKKIKMLNQNDERYYI